MKGELSPKIRDMSNGKENGIKAILFDLDGTLIDSAGDLTISVRHMLYELRLPDRSEREVRSFIGHGMKNLIMKSLGEGNEERYEEARKRFTEHYSEHCLDNTRLFGGFEEYLPELKHLCPLGILTNKDYFYTQKILEGLGIDSLFPFVAGGDSFAVRKPDPGGVRYFCMQYDLQPAEVAFVGDSDVDIQTAKNAGCPSFFCKWGLGGRIDYPGTRSFDSVKDLGEELKRLAMLCVPEQKKDDN